jgi:hypothetical protein
VYIIFGSPQLKFKIGTLNQITVTGVAELRNLRPTQMRGLGIISRTENLAILFRLIVKINRSLVITKG